jgi:hypothetical protein
MLRNGKIRGADKAASATILPIEQSVAVPILAAG